MSFVNRVIDFLASQDIVDLYFILSDMVDIEQTEDEIYESAEYDARSMSVMGFLGNVALKTVSAPIKLASGITGRFIYGVFRQTESQKLDNGLESTPSHLLHLEYMDFDKYDYKD